MQDAAYSSAGKNQLELLRVCGQKERDEIKAA
jgi:hypothetical protein